MPARADEPRQGVAQYAGFSLHAGIGAEAEQKTPYRDGTTHIVLEPLDFIARLAALVPAPRVHLTRFHGVFRSALGVARGDYAGGERGGAEASSRAAADASRHSHELGICSVS